MFGVTDEGFVPKPQSDIEEDLAAGLRLAISPILNTQAESPMGQVIGIIGAIAREGWEVGQDVYSASSILTATQQALDRKLALSTLTRGAAGNSTVTATVNLDAGATLPIGSQAHVLGDADALFETTAVVTNGGGGAADFPVQMQSVDTGPIRANAGTLTQIFTPVAGWNSVTNAEDAALGSIVEVDSTARGRYLNSAGGKGITPLVRTQRAVEQVTDVISVVPFENSKNVTDPVTGISANSIEIVVRDGGLANDDDIAQAIWDTKGGGIGTFGTESGTASDSLSNAQTVNFNRVAELDVWLEVDIRITGGFSSGTGITALETAIAEWGDANLGTGDDVILSQLCQPIFDFGGVQDIVEVRIGLAPSPTSTVNLAVLPREIADLDTSRIAIAIVP